MLLISKAHLDSICKERSAEKPKSSFLDNLSEERRKEVRDLEEKGLRFSAATGELLGCEDQTIEGTSILNLLPSNEPAPTEYPAAEEIPEPTQDPQPEPSQEPSQEPTQEPTQELAQELTQEAGPSQPASPKKRGRKPKKKPISGYPSWRRAYDLRRKKSQRKSK